MELVPFNRDADQDDLRALSIQPSRRAIPTPHQTTRVGNRSKFLSKTRPAMGPTPRRSLRIADQPPASSIHDLEAIGRRRRARRLTAPVEAVGQRLSMPTVEPDLASSSEDQAGEDNGDHHRTAFAVSSLVPDNQSNDNSTPDAYPTPSSSSGSRKRSGHSREEPPLVFVRLEDKRRRLLDKGGNNDTTSIVIDNPTIQRRHQQYASRSIHPMGHKPRRRPFGTTASPTT